MKTKVLIVLEDTDRGGAETQALLLAKGLISRGHTVEILSFGSSKGSYWLEFSSIGVPIHLTGFKSKLIVTSINGIKGYLLRIKYILQLILQVRKIQPHVILPFTYPPNIIMGQFWKFMGANKCFWNQRDGGILFKNNSKERRILQNVTAVLSNSTEGIDFLKSCTNRAIKLLPNGVVLPLLIDESLSENKVINVVMIANLHSLKDHLTLLKAWILCVKNNSNIKLFFLGKGGDSKITVDAFINDNKLQKSVDCLGVINDVSGFLKTCHIGVFSSVKEGLPNGILECMAAGLPVVATRMQGALEALGEDYPFLSNPKDYKTMAEQLLYLINSESERKKMGQKNRERIENHFTVAKMVAAYESIIFN